MKLGDGDKENESCVCVRECVSVGLCVVESDTSYRQSSVRLHGEPQCGSIKDHSHSLSAKLPRGFLLGSQPELGLSTPLLEMHIMHKVSVDIPSGQTEKPPHEAVGQAAIRSDVPFCIWFCVFRIYHVTHGNKMVNKQVHKECAFYAK